MAENGHRSTTSLARIRPTDDDRPSYKRLIVCCDGTWLDSTGSAIHDGEIPPVSNVTRIIRALRSESSDGVSQIVYYQAGIGSQGTNINKVVGGATAAGIAQNVREAYAFIAYNYANGDEIFLIGFSRGAFTARSVGGLIANVGVLTKAGMESFPIIYKDYAHRNERDYRSPLPDVPFRDKPQFRDPDYVRELQRRGLTTTEVQIKAIGVWDTVGALGIPKVSWMPNTIGRIKGKGPEDTHEYSFYDTQLDDCVENAFQALALDEKRSPFAPAVWERGRSRNTNLIQVWFPGVHTNIGGGYNDQELANISLAWMMAMLSPLLDLNLDYIITEKYQNEDYYESKRKRPRDWSMGKIYNSNTGVFAVSGSKTRTPGLYYRMDPRTGEYTRKRLRDTNEYVHSSVRSRMVLGGPGYAGRGKYDPAALRDFDLRSDDSSGLPTPWYWEDRGPEATILPEAPLRSVEKLLLSESPDIEDYVLGPPNPRRRSKRS